jgi:hypothetical protein
MGSSCSGIMIAVRHVKRPPAPTRAYPGKRTRLHQSRLRKKPPPQRALRRLLSPHGTQPRQQSAETKSAHSLTNYAPQNSQPRLRSREQIRKEPPVRSQTQSASLDKMFSWTHSLHHSLANGGFGGSTWRLLFGHSARSRCKLRSGKVCKVDAGRLRGNIP